MLKHQFFASSEQISCFIAVNCQSIYQILAFLQLLCDLLQRVPKARHNQPVFKINGSRNPEELSSLTY